MLEKVFWNVFEHTGNINAYVASKDFESNHEHDNRTYNYYFYDNDNNEDYNNNEMR